MTDEELRALVANNAQAIGRLEQTAERAAQTAERNSQAISRLEKSVASTDRQVQLISEQVRSLTDNQAINEVRFTRAERQIQGIYDLFGTIAREQAERSQLIDQQIQALIDERCRS